MTTIRRAGIMASFGLLLASDALAQRGRPEVRDGNRLYAEERFDEARERYLDALRKAPGSPLIRFNEANALYQSDEYQRAMEAYRQALETGDPALQGQAWYNLGNALYRQQQFQESLDAYKEALRLDPNDVDAKHNLELALEQLQQQQQEQNQQDQRGGEQDEQQRQQDQGDQQQEDQRQDAQQQQGEQQPPEEQQDQPRQAPGDGEAESEPQQQPQPQPGQMSREEAERLLQAINEDPGKVRRQRESGRPRTRVVKPW